MARNLAGRLAAGLATAVLALLLSSIVSTGIVSAKCPGCPPDDPTRGKVVLTVFHQPGDAESERVLRLLNATASAAGYLAVVARDSLSPESETVRQVLNDTYGVPDAQKSVVPAVFTPDEFLLNIEEVRRGIQGLVRERERFAQTPVEKVKGSLRYLKISMIAAVDGVLAVVVLGAGLVDGLNPCALSILLFLMACLSTFANRKRVVLTMGASFVFGSFVAYLLLGLGLYQITRTDFFGQLSEQVYLVLGILALVLGFVALFDACRVRRLGRVNVSLVKIPTTWKRRLQGTIRQTVRFQRGIVISGFALGGLSSVVEFPCTGQVYLPTIALVGNPLASGKPFFYLLGYNLMFVIPLVVVVGLSVFLTSSQRIGRVVGQYLAPAKFLTAILLFIVSAYMLGGLS